MFYIVIWNVFNFAFHVRKSASQLLRTLEEIPTSMTVVGVSFDSARDRTQIWEADILTTRPSFPVSLPIYVVGRTHLCSLEAVVLDVPGEVHDDVLTDVLLIASPRRPDWEPIETGKFVLLNDASGAH